MNFPYKAILFDWAYTLVDLVCEDDRAAFSVMMKFLKDQGVKLPEFELIFNEYYHPSTIKNHNCDPKFLDKRSDDNEKTIMYRYETYLEKTLPILDFYKEQNMLHQINGMADIDQIFKEIQAIIASLET